MAVNVFRFRGAWAGAEAHDDDEQQALDQNENRECPPEDGLKEAEELGTEIGSGSERRLRQLRAGAGRDEEDHSEYGQRHGVKLDRAPRPVNARVILAQHG